MCTVESVTQPSLLLSKTFLKMIKKFDKKDEEAGKNLFNLFCLMSFRAVD